MGRKANYIYFIEMTELKSENGIERRNLLMRKRQNELH